MKAGSDLVFQMHYTANGKPGMDRSRIGLIFAKEPPKERIFTTNATEQQVRDSGRTIRIIRSSRASSWQQDMKLIDLMPHMHLRGKDFEYRAVYPDRRDAGAAARAELRFQLAALLLSAGSRCVLPKGTRIECTAHFDNSPNNPANPDAKQEVRWGDQSWQEMMIGWFDVAIGREPETRPMFSVRRKRTRRRLGLVDIISVCAGAVSGQTTTRSAQDVRGVLVCAVAAWPGCAGNRSSLFRIARVDPFGRDCGAGPRRQAARDPLARGGAQRLRLVPYRGDRAAGTNYFLYIVTNAGRTPAAWRSTRNTSPRPTRAGSRTRSSPSPTCRISARCPIWPPKFAGQTTRVYLLDIWIPPEARPPGFRLEVQLKTGDWTVWPIEVRVLPVTVPAVKGDATRPLPGDRQSADQAARAPVEDYFEGVRESHEIDADTVRAVIRRNAIQDMALAAKLDRDALKKLWQAPHPDGAEWYLRIRDWIYRQLTR